MLSWAALLILLIVLAVFIAGRSRALGTVQGAPSLLHSRPDYHGAYCAIWTGIAGYGVLLAGMVLAGFAIRFALFAQIPDALGPLSRIEEQLIVSDGMALARDQLASRTDETRERIAALFTTLSSAREWGVAGLALLATLAAAGISLGQVSKDFRARNRTEQVAQVVLTVAAAIAILTTVGIVASLIGETLNFFSQVSPLKFLFGTLWSPLSGVHDGVIDEDKVGAIPLFAGTALITLIAMTVAVPVGLLAAIYLSDYATQRVRSVVKPVLEILAGIPTVVYGFFAAITVAPFLRDTGEAIGLTVSSESALAAGIVMGIMIIPFISHTVGPAIR